MHVFSAVGGALVLLLLGGVVVSSLGVAVLSVRPRTVATCSFGGFAIAFGLVFSVVIVGQALHLPEAIHATIYFVAILAAMVGLVAMAFSFPTPLRPDERNLLVPAGIFTLLAYVANRIRLSEVPLSFFSDPTIAATFSWMAPLVAAPVSGYLLLLALRFRRADTDAMRQQTALTAGALVLYIGYAAGAGAIATHEDSVFSTSPLVRLGAALNLLVIGGTGIAWLAATNGPGSRPARNVALLTFAMILLGLIDAAFLPVIGLAGITRVALVVVLAYAILRHRLLGIDVKLRFAISKSTIAAVFIAVFFIASEAAQQFFGDTLGSTYVGIAAAGALVFAMAPLQRAAERLAEKAVPVHPPPATDLATDRGERYRVLLRRYLGDGRLSREEEIALAHAAAGMGIPGHEALRLRHEVEDEGGRA